MTKYLERRLVCYGCVCLTNVQTEEGSEVRLTPLEKEHEEVTKVQVPLY